MSAPSQRKGTVSGAFEKLAEWTGLEPATSGVTGQHSNQLNYHSAFCNFTTRCCWLTTASGSDWPSNVHRRNRQNLVGAEGFEPPTLSV